MHRLFLVVLAIGLFPATPVRAQAGNDEELIQMVVGFLAEADRDIRALAFEQIRTAAAGQGATLRFAAELPKLSAESQVGLISALADRGDDAARPAILELLDSTNAEVVAAAVLALGKLGNAQDTQRLLELFASDAEPMRNVARQSLLGLRGDDVSQQIASGLKGAQIPTQVGLIELLTARRATDTIPTLMSLAQGNDATLRSAAMNSLGQLAGTDQIAEMVRAVLKAPAGAERNEAEKNLMFVCRRIEDESQQAAPLLAAMQSLSASERVAMIPMLGRVGGEQALAEVESAIASRDKALHAAGIRAISNWPDASVTPQLMAIATGDAHPDHCRIARMSLLRIAPLPDGRSDQEKLESLRAAMKLAANDKERTFGIKRAAAIRIVDTLRYVLPFLDQSEFSQEACQTIVELAHDRALRDSQKEEFHAALDKVIATTKDEVLIDRANRYKKGQTWVRN